MFLSCFIHTGPYKPHAQISQAPPPKGFHITFVNTEFNHRRLLRSRGSDSLNGLPTFRFETIPDGLPPSDADATQDVPSLSVATTNYCLAPFRELLHKLNDAASSGGVPPVTCIVSDSIMSFTLDASKELGIPNVLFWTSSPCSFVDESYLTNGYLDMVLDWIPGLEGIRLKNMPSFLQTTNPDDIMFNFALREVDRARGGSAVILNTFDDLEKEIIKSLSTHLPPIYTLGPLHLLLKNQIQNKALNGMEVDGNAKRDEIERTVRELMLGEKGKEMRKKATELKKMAEEALGLLLDLLV
ncbi:hypothetical protein FEM48_Zijuj06G0112000 [Ziziphus jujuba var. spinosa]|uniref:7-deoxyloganetin glucosyltransferase-like n=1 Tax=Ziziphus jujuba var. spinosa TaxID=714518 RepID=A0A978V8Y4_ZIZJJ|nr:hypothetical protein FEM48_Zijuj06G0112000 [Ziziphus jujuba var. spinosa]